MTKLRRDSAGTARGSPAVATFVAARNRFELKYSKGNNDELRRSTASHPFVVVAG